MGCWEIDKGLSDDFPWARPGTASLNCLLVYLTNDAPGIGRKMFNRSPLLGDMNLSQDVVVHYAWKAANKDRDSDRPFPTTAPFLPEPPQLE